MFWRSTRRKTLNVHANLMNRRNGVDFVIIKDYLRCASHRHVGGILPVSLASDTDDRPMTLQRMFYSGS